MNTANVITNELLLKMSFTKHAHAGIKIKAKRCT